VKATPLDAYVLVVWLFVYEFVSFELRFKGSTALLPFLNGCRCGVLSGARVAKVFCSVSDQLRPHIKTELFSTNGTPFVSQHVIADIIIFM
jgi:hypothetical protein